MKKAIATMSIGDSFRQMSMVSWPTFKTYGNKIGADFITIKESKLSTIPHFEKFQLADLLNTYDRIIYLDNDTIIRGDCPDLFAIVQEDELGLYDESLLATDEEKASHKIVMKRAFKIYDEAFIEGGFYNTGVMVMSKVHRPLFGLPAKQFAMEYMEQPYINIRIRQLGLKVKDIGFEFNRMQYVTKAVGKGRLESYIVHYAGLPGCVELMAADVAAWSKL